ncbi:peptidylprolyl isomerase [Wenxinia saemankumensis]|uniref:Parvulin-like PPIase n=1 Tax=Wenxinia saemankumensis TaxID=1447782 RepID=A0A1M6FTI9_9RHOB|nr:peptidylprolyl isomerase [Wenxinia saemankumensis]SHJ01002.1 peptidyl-prolyl cis-trans isomerase C [Wenxinia saemankumensis]
MTRITATLAVSALALAAALPAAAQDEAEAPEGEAAAPAEMPTADPATVIATVNGTDITLGQMIIARAQLPQQYQQFPPDVLFEGVLDQIIQQQLLSETVEGVPARVDYALENQRRALLAGEAVTDIVDTAVTDEAIQQRYEEEFGAAEPVTEWNASHILVETEEEIQDVIARLEGGEDFAEVAQEVSIDPGSGMNGGNLGWFGPGMMVAPFEEAVSGLEVGEVSEPVQTQFGYHVVLLNETREQEPPPLTEVQGEIASAIQQEALQERIDALMGEAEIEMAETGELDPAVLNNLDLLEP